MAATREFRCLYLYDNKVKDHDGQGKKMNAWKEIRERIQYEFLLKIALEVTAFGTFVSSFVSSLVSIVHFPAVFLSAPATRTKIPL